MKNSKIILTSLCVSAIIVLLSSITYAKYVLDCNIVVANLAIDRTKPEGTVSYSVKEMTRENVLVTVKLSEPVYDIEGWNLSEDKLILTKTYEQNATDEIKIIDLSGNENVVKISVQNIDRDAPSVSLISIQNSNTEYQNYANKTHTITAKIKITDLGINDTIDISKLDVLVDENKNKCTKVLQNLEQKDTEIIFDLVLTDIEGNGNLKLNIPQAFVTDMAGNEMQEAVLNLGIAIDNIKPQGSYSQEMLQNGKVRAKITSNEEIIELNNWDTSDNKIFTKDFPANVSYIIEIMDFAQNKSEVEINITGATYIVLTYASHNSIVGWTYGWGNYDIAGRDAVKANPLYKTEALAFRITGGVPKDFLKIKGYVNSYWNNLCDYGKCSNTGYKYKLGNVEELSMASSNLSNIDGNNYIQIGGAGINKIENTDYNNENPIPYEILYNESDEYPFGISEIQISLEDYNELSVAYQILVNKKGWLKTASNGETTTAGKTLPMSAIRVAIIPSSELESLTNLWNKDVGKYNVD